MTPEEALAFALRIESLERRVAALEARPEVDAAAVAREMVWLHEQAERSPMGQARSFVAQCRRRDGNPV